MNQQITGTEAKMNKIRVSPVSFTVDFDWKRQMKTETAMDEIGMESEKVHVPVK